MGDKLDDGSFTSDKPPVVTSAEAVPPVIAPPNPTPRDPSTTGDHAIADGAAAESSGRRPGEIMRLLGLVRELRHDLAASLATQRDLRRMNEAYVARVGSIPLQEEAAQARLIELAEVRREAATHANDADVLRHELATLRRTTDEADAARSEREVQMQSAVREHVEALARARAEIEHHAARSATLDREVIEERQRRVELESKAAEAAQAAEAALRAQTSAAETQRASVAQARSELQHHAEALERAQSEAERLLTLNAALDRKIVDERHGRAAVEAMAAEAAENAKRAEIAAAEAAKAAAALQSEVRERSARVDALERRAAALQDESDRLRRWHEAVTSTKLWHLVGRPGGRLEERTGAKTAR